MKQIKSMKENKAYKFRIYPNSDQVLLIQKTFGCVRFVYNHFLNERNELYKNEKKSINYVKQSSNLTILKKELDWLYEIDSRALQSSLKNLDTAFKNFFQKKAKYPRFKAKRDNTKSYRSGNVNNSIRVEGTKLKLPKLGLVKAKFHRQIPKNHRILSATISQVPTGAYFVSIVTEFEQEIVKVKSNNNIVGLDFSMKELFVSSENQRADYPRFFRLLESKLAKAQKALSRKVKFSNNWNKQKRKVAKIHFKIKNSRYDFLHKISTTLVNKYNAIAIEDLNMQAMSQALNFGKSVSDNGWGMFTKMLKYKTDLSGKQLVKIDKFYPSSKTCSCCGLIKENLTLNDRVYTCECGSVLDRDLNASINIRNQGQLLLAY